MKDDKEEKKKGETAYPAGASPFVVYSIADIIPQNKGISRVYEIKHGAKPPSLDNTYVTHRSLFYRHLRASQPEEYKALKAKRRRGRFWQRAKTGENILRAQRKKGWSFKFLTLTSGYASGDISRDFDVLLKRLRRLWRVNSVPYIKVSEFNKKGDLEHLHIILYSPYIAVEKLRKMWFEVHHAYEIFIERIPENDIDKNLGYLGKYLVKELERRFSYSRAWVGGITGISWLWKGAVKYFFKLKMNDFSLLLQAWEEFIEGVVAGEIPKRFDSLFDFLVISTW